jgi:Uma2 family endonuclease
VDVVLDQENTVQPDLIFVAAANLGIVQRRALFGVPDLLVEMVSPSSVRRDRYDKRELYPRFGVKEYWIGDPANRAFEVLTLVAGHYELHSSAEERGRVHLCFCQGSSSIYPNCSNGLIFPGRPGFYGRTLLMLLA